jgi:RimJ/RimL family protein N-acetyltransferase
MALAEPEIQQRLEKLVTEEPGPLGVWAAELKSTGDFVGWFMLRRGRFEDPELGFMILKKHWGQGYTTEIARSLIDYGLNELRLSSIVACANPSNVASIRILEKIGMRFQKSFSMLNPRLNREILLNLYQCTGPSSDQGSSQIV